MNDFTNPYAPPQVMEATLVAAQPSDQRLWRSGNLLVMAKDAQLPPVCVKSNLPASGWLKRKLQWHHPAVAIALLLGLWPYVILALILTKRATIHIGLTEEWFARRRTRIAIAWALGLLSLGLFAGGIAMLGTRNGEAVGGCSMLASVFVFLAAILYGQYATRLVRPTRITNHFLWLKGVHPELLSQLPDWPGYE